MSSNWTRRAALALLMCHGSGIAFAQESITDPASQQISAMAVIPDGTVVSIEITEPLASSTHKRGDTFSLALLDPILIDGVELVPAGTPGTGQIIHAAAARGGGAPGELLIAARSLETASGPLPLRGFKLGATGDDNSGMALGVSLAAGAFAMFIRGREVVIPAGTHGSAKVKATPSSQQPSVQPPPDAPAQPME